MENVAEKAFKIGEQHFFDMSEWIEKGDISDEAVITLVGTPLKMMALYDILQGLDFPVNQAYLEYYKTEQYDENNKFICNSWSQGFYCITFFS